MIDQLQTTTGLRHYARYLEDKIKYLEGHKKEYVNTSNSYYDLREEHNKLRRKYSQLSSLIPKTLRDYTKLRKDYLKTQFRLKEAKKEVSATYSIMRYYNDHLIPQYHDYINSLISNKNG